MKPLLLIFCASTLAIGADLYTQATGLYNRTEYDAVLALYQQAPPQRAVDFGLIGRTWFMKTDYKKASEALEKAVALEPLNSDLYLWLGRAYGRRAESASVFAAPGYASKSRNAFEKAVSLDPKNKEALSDLFEYYLQAPGFLGGGESKARALIEKIAAVDPAERYFAESRLAEHNKEWNTTEAKLRRAIDVAPQQAGRVMDLARHLARQGRISESEAAFERAAKIDPKSPQLLFIRAQTYVEGKRNLDEARALLQQYLKSPLTPNDPPRQEAEKLLRQAGG